MNVKDLGFKNDLCTIDQIEQEQNKLEQIVEYTLN